MLVHLGSANDHDWPSWTSSVATHALAHHKSKRKDHILGAALTVELMLFSRAHQIPSFAAN